MAKLKEYTDYTLIPVGDTDDDAAWEIRFETGRFTETTIRYGAVRVDGENECLRFNFEVTYSPDPDLTSEDEELQNHAADALEAILERAYADGTLVTKEI